MVPSWIVLNIRATDAREVGWETPLKKHAAARISQRYVLQRFVTNFRKSHWPATPPKRLRFSKSAGSIASKYEDAFWEYEIMAQFWARAAAGKIIVAP